MNYRTLSKNNLFLRKGEETKLIQYVGKEILFTGNIANVNSSSGVDRMLFDNWLKEYCYHVEKKKRTYKNRRNLEGMFFELLLPKRLKIEKNIHLLKLIVSTLVEEACEGYNPHYFVTITGKGKVKKLMVHICDRYFFLNGKMVLKTFAYDRYVDPNTGKFVKYETHENKEQLIKIVSKGDTKEVKIHLSDKHRIAHLTTSPGNFEVHKKQFMILMEQYKKKLERVIQKHFGLFKDTPLLFSKLSYKKLTRSNEKWQYKDDKPIFNDNDVYYKKRRIKAINSILDIYNDFIYRNQDYLIISKLKEVEYEVLELKKQLKKSFLSTVEEKLLEVKKLAENGILLAKWFDRTTLGPIDYFGENFVKIE